jgi:hypothetical protein
VPLPVCHGRRHRLCVDGTRLAPRVDGPLHGISGLRTEGTTTTWCREPGNTNPDDFAITFGPGVAEAWRSRPSVLVGVGVLPTGRARPAWGAGLEQGAMGPDVMARWSRWVSADQFSKSPSIRTRHELVGVTTRVQGANNGSCHLAMPMPEGFGSIARMTRALSWTQLATANVDITGRGCDDRRARTTACISTEPS